MTNVDFFADNVLAGSLQNGPFSFLWNAPSNGPYVLSAVAENSANLSSTSPFVNITVANGFAIVAPPTNEIVGVSNSATFSVITNPTNGIAYQWLSNGIPIDGATLSTYTVDGTQNSVPGSNSYSVVVTSGGVSLTSQPPAVLTVLGPPTLGPILMVTNGSDITLSVTASDSVPFYYQWLLNGNGIPGASNNFAAGTNTISYTISNAQPFDSGNYQVVVANIVAAQESPVFAVAVAFGTNTAVSTNVNFASSLNLGPLTNGVGVVGINSSNSVSPANGPAQIAGKPAAGFLWYNWTASFTGVISMTTRGSSFDTLLGVYTGSYPGSLVSVGEDDDSGGFFTSLETFNCVQGTTYQIVVAGYKGATGNVVLAVSPGPPLLPGPVGGYSVGAPLPVILQQPASQIVNVGDTVTLSVTASNAVTYQWYFANIPISSLNTNILVTNTPTVAGVSTNYLIIKNFPTNAVGNYYVMVGTAQSEPAAVELQDPALTLGSPPYLAVDKFSDAVDLTAGGATEQRYRPDDAGGDTGGFTLSQSFSTMSATKEEGEPNHAGQPGGASYWYSYTAPGSGSLRFDTIGSTFNTILAIYTGPGNSFSTLTNVGAAYTTNYVQQGQPVVVVTNVIARTKYFIAIDGYLGASGAARLNVILTNAIGVLVTLTNTQPVVSISTPKNNYLTTSSNITFKGTVRGVGSAIQGLTSVQLILNGNTPVSATLGTPTVSPVLIRVNGGVEEAAAETIPWTCTLSLVPGANFITTQGVSTNNGTASAVVIRNVFFVPALPSPSMKSTLTLVTSGNGKITGLANGASLEVNNIYKVTAVPVGNWLFTNWTSGTNTNSLSPLVNNNSALTFVMSSNLILQANFVTNPFTAVAGVYNGLFSPAIGVTEESSGFFSATIPASSRGTYSAKLLLNGGSYPFTGTFDLSGKAEKVLTLSDNSLVAVILNLNLAAPDDMITGMVNNDIPGGWSSDLLAERAVFNAKNPATNYAGKFTLIVPPGSNAPTNEPGGFGYATLTNIPNGLVTISGQLGDGTAISQSVPVAKDGNIPLYVSLYSRQGSFQGWLTVANDTNNTPAQSIVGNNLSWIKISSRAGTLYAGGFTNTNIMILGSLYQPSNPLALTNGTLTISNGNLGSALVYSNLTIVNNKLVNNDPNNPPNPLSGVITPGTGILTVTFKATGASANTVAKGVVLQDTSSTNGAGWFLGTGQTGYFLLQQ